MAGLGTTLGLVLLLGWTLLPILYLIALSVKPEQIMLEPPRSFFVPTLERYHQLFQGSSASISIAASGSLGAPILNSLITATLGTLGALILGGLGAFAMTFLEFRGKGSLFFGILITRMFPPVTTIIPIYLALRVLGLIDTRTALILLFVGFQIPLVLWILHTYLRSIPQELLEGAAVEGASLPVIAVRVVLPLSGPGFVSAAILSFIFNWNEFLFPLIVTAFNAKTGSVAILNYTEQQMSVLWGPLAAAGVAMILPVVLFTLGLRSYLVQGLTAGALRG